MPQVREAPAYISRSLDALPETAKEKLTEAASILLTKQRS
jgi:hypothetical protein